jgi:hypothetical protein
MLFTFPEDARWNADRQAVEFGVSIGEYEGVVRVPRQALLRFRDGAVTPNGALRRTTCTGPAWNALRSASSETGSSPRMQMSKLPAATCASRRDGQSRWPQAPAS